MKHLKLYEEYTSNLDHPGFFKTYEETENWLDEMGIDKYTIKKNLVVDVDSSVYISERNLTHLPVQFGIVNGNFDCSENQLTSLTGAPKKVDGIFDCSNNYLTSLTGAPNPKNNVGGWFSCENNYLTLVEYTYINNIPIWNTGDNPYKDCGNQISIKNMAKYFYKKIQKNNLNNQTILRILISLKNSTPQVYAELDKLVGVDDWITRLENSETHKDIMDL